MSRYLLDLADAFGPRDDEQVSVRIGTVDAVGTGVVDVTLGGGATVITDIPHLAGYTPTVGDTVVVLRAGTAMVVLDRFA
jgi:hypothetical protein